ncbi:hypothetical protein HED60_18010 [Planctomycetales bacterium ZRK34]|nr:hypothetical protein HED60_18010 [Planctomycetales bacterium ZRK34]
MSDGDLHDASTDAGSILGYAGTLAEPWNGMSEAEQKAVVHHLKVLLALPPDRRVKVLSLVASITICDTAGDVGFKAIDLLSLLCRTQAILLSPERSIRFIRELNHLVERFTREEYENDDRHANKSGVTHCSDANP